MKQERMLVGVAAALLAAALFSVPSQEASSTQHHLDGRSKPVVRTGDPEVLPVTPSQRTLEFDPFTGALSARPVTPPSVQIQVTFVEVQTNRTEELSFDWVERPFAFDEETPAEPNNFEHMSAPGD